jgi:hypothetical protein
VSACAGSLQNGQTTTITDGNGNVIGTVGKDSSGNLLVTGGNGSNFNQTPQFSTTISGNTLTTSNGAIEAQMTLTPTTMGGGGSADINSPAHTSFTVVGTPGFVDDVNQVEAKAKADGIAWNPGEGSIFDELSHGPRDVIVRQGASDDAGPLVGGGPHGPIVVEWNPTLGTYVRTGAVGTEAGLDKYQSPALGLIHELGHAFQMAIMGMRATMDNPLPEKPVIDGIERQWAKAYSEPVRNPLYAHGGVDKPNTDLFDHTVVHW